MESMWQCKHCNKEFEFIKTADKANHSRWCEQNPKFQHYKNNPSYLNACNTSIEKRFGQLKPFTVECSKCSITFEVQERELSFPSKDKYFCSKSCANSRTITLRHRKKTSETLSGREYIPNYEVTKQCEECGKEFKYNKSGRNRHKRFCCNSCKAKYTNRKRDSKLRTTRTAFRNYRLDCQFQFSLNDYPDEFDFNLIEQHGWYLPKNRGDNLNGVSRDHMVSVKFGFDNSIPSEYIRHPANCKLLLHNSNVSKGPKNSITYGQLLERIQNWNTKYNHSS